MHNAGIEVKSGIWTTQDPKYNIEIIEGVPRLVNAYHGRPVSLDVAAFTLLSHDNLAQTTINFYLHRAESQPAPVSHLKAIRERVEAFQKFFEDYPERMKDADTTALE